MTLTQTAGFTKRFLLFFTIFIFIAFSGWLSFRYYYFNIYLPSIPPPEPVADLKFGKLPNLQFVESTASATNYSYSLDTVTGDLPDKLPKLMKVFFIPQRSITLLDPDKSTNLSKQLGFPIGPQIVSPTEFRYADDKNGEFIIDLNSGNFRLNRYQNFDPRTFEIGTLPETKKLEQDFRKFLTDKGLLKNQLSSGRIKVVYNTKNSLKDSSTATISIWPADINKIPIVNPHFDIANINQVVRKADKEQDRILSMNFNHYEIDQKTFSTYPVKLPVNAFEDLKTGKGALIKLPNTAKISIRNIYLAYYQSDSYSPYLQPIFVFEGDSFTAYVKAIPDEYLEK